MTVNGGHAGTKKGPNWGHEKFSGLKNGRRKTKGQQLKGKIVSALFHTFWQFSPHVHTFSEFFRIFPPRLFLRIKGFDCFFSSKIRKENKRE